MYIFTHSSHGEIKTVACNSVTLAKWPSFQSGLLNVVHVYIQFVTCFGIGGCINHCSFSLRPSVCLSVTHILLPLLIVVILRNCRCQMTQKNAKEHKILQDHHSCFWPRNVFKRGISYENASPSVHPSVRLSGHSRVTSKQFKISKYACLYVYEAKFHNPELKCLFRTNALTRGTPPVDSENLTNIPRYLGNNVR